MSLCAVCAGLGKTCCQQTDVLLTAADIERIGDHTRRRDFFETRQPRDPKCLGDEGDPNWLRYTIRPDGSRTVVRHSATGDCFFLTSRGCPLPCDVRPLICRLHPLAYTEAGITGTVADCPKVLTEGRELLQAIGMEIDAGIQWHAQLYAELRDALPGSYATWLGRGATTAAIQAIPPGASGTPDLERRKDRWENRRRPEARSRFAP